MRTWRALGALTAAFAVVVAVGAVLVARENRLDTRDAALRAAVDTAAFVGLGLDRDLGPALRRGQLSAEQVREFEATLAIDAGRRPLRRLSIWRRDGRIIYSTDRARIGRLEPLNRQVRAALTGRSATRLCETAAACERDADASAPNIASFVPLQPGGPATRPAGVYEVAVDFRPLQAAAARATRRLYAFIAGGALLLWLALLPVTVRIAALLGERIDLRRWRTLRAFRYGLANGVELHFQPKVTLESGKACGAEALVRWRRGGRLVPPGEFLADVEGSDLMGPLTDIVLDRGVEQLGHWLRGGRKLGLAINLSAVNLAEETLPERVAAALERHGVPAGLLTLELTETAVLDDMDASAIMLRRLSDLGIRLSIDDFGTGYSSLSRLNLFPIAEVKIDRSFVRRLPQDGPKYVAGVIRLARDLGMDIVAEGVEDAETAETLRRLGCEVAQGFHFSSPLPADKLAAWLDEHHEEPIDVLDALAQEHARDTIKRAVRAAREFLDMDVSWLAELKDGKKVFRLVDGDGDSFGFADGMEMDASGAYCQRVVAGELNYVVDTAVDERVRELPVTRQADIASYIGVPLNLPDGRVYGTLCCASHTPNHLLGDRDVQFLNVLGRLVADELARQELQWQQIRTLDPADRHPAR